MEQPGRQLGPEAPYQRDFGSEGPRSGEDLLACSLGKGGFFGSLPSRTAFRASARAARATCSAALGEVPAGVSGGFLGVPAGITPVRLSKPQVKSRPSPRGSLGATRITLVLSDGSSWDNTA